MKGAPASFARRREISVLPTPVGPIIRMFFGKTSSRSAPSSCRRRQRLRSAIDTARLASAWPTMKRSSSETISRGEKSVMAETRYCPATVSASERRFASDDRRPGLPLAYRLVGIEQHDNVQSQVVTNVKADGDFEDQRQRNRRHDRQLQSEQKADDHEARVSDRVDDAVAVVVERSGFGPIAVDNEAGVLQQF